MSNVEYEGISDDSADDEFGGVGEAFVRHFQIPQPAHHRNRTTRRGDHPPPPVMGFQQLLGSHPNPAVRSTATSTMQEFEVDDPVDSSSGEEVDEAIDDAEVDREGDYFQTRSSVERGTRIPPSRSCNDNSIRSRSDLMNPFSGGILRPFPDRRFPALDSASAHLTPPPHRIVAALKRESKREADYLYKQSNRSSSDSSAEGNLPAPPSFSEWNLPAPPSSDAGINWKQPKMQAASDSNWSLSDSCFETFSASAPRINNITIL